MQRRAREKRRDRASLPHTTCRNPPRGIADRTTAVFTATGGDPPCSAQRRAGRGCLSWKPPEGCLEPRPSIWSVHAEPPSPARDLLDPCLLALARPRSRGARADRPQCLPAGFPPGARCVGFHRDQDDVPHQDSRWARRRTASDQLQGRRWLAHPPCGHRGARRLPRPACLLANPAHFQRFAGRHARAPRSHHQRSHPARRFHLD